MNFYLTNKYNVDVAHRIFIITTTFGTLGLRTK
jgi:hypothetical protein